MKKIKSSTVSFRVFDDDDDDDDVDDDEPDADELEPDEVDVYEPDSSSSSLDFFVSLSCVLAVAVPAAHRSLSASSAVATMASLERIS
jgi:hypothetical protein